MYISRFMLVGEWGGEGVLTQKIEKKKNNKKKCSFALVGFGVSQCFLRLWFLLLFAHNPELVTQLNVRAFVDEHTWPMIIGQCYWSILVNESNT